MDDELFSYSCYSSHILRSMLATIFSVLSMVTYFSQLCKLTFSPNSANLRTYRIFPCSVITYIFPDELLRTVHELVVGLVVLPPLLVAGGHLDLKQGFRYYSLTRLSAHSLTPTHSLIHSLTHSLTHSLIYSLTHSLTHSNTHLLNNSLTH